MFEDLITEKKKINIRTQCPHCHSYYIRKNAMKVRIDGRWGQLVECRTCKKQWHIIYSEDLSTAWLEKKNKK